MDLTKNDVLATGKPRYVGWGQVPAGLKTRTQWSKAGMRLQRDVEPIAYVFGCTAHAAPTHHPLYSQSQIEPKRQPRPGSAAPLTAENIGAALFEINKAAKRRRDAAQSAYQQRQHGLAGHHKRRKEAYYDLKNRVLEHAVTEGLATFCGFHAKTDVRSEYVTDDGCDDFDEDKDEWPDDDEDFKPRPHSRRVSVRTATHMACYEFGGFRFHRILDQVPADGGVEIKDRGDWTGQATPRATDLTPKDAEATQRAYPGP